MDWAEWESRKAGEAKLSVEEAEQYITELVLSRSIALSFGDEKKDFLCTPARLQSISRSRRVIQTLGTIVKMRQIEYYFQAVYLLQFLHNLYPNVIPVQDYGQLLVYLKIEAVIYKACCSLSRDKTEAVMKQFFEDYDDDSFNTADKQQLKNEHIKGRVKLSQLLDTNERIGLSIEHLSSQQFHKFMCSILESFFKGIDDILPPPTIIQIIQDFCQRKTALTDNSVSKFIAPVVPTGALTKGKSLPSKQYAPFISGMNSSKVAGSSEMTGLTDLPNKMTESPKESRQIRKVPEDSSMITTSSYMTANSSEDAFKPSTINKAITVVKVVSGPSKIIRSSEVVAKLMQDNTSKATTLNNPTTQDKIVNLPSKITNSPKISPNSPSNSPKISSSSPEISSNSPNITGATPQTINSPVTTEDTIDSTDSTNTAFSNLKFISTHARIKRTPIPSKRFVPHVTNIKCQRNLKRSNGESVNSDCEKTLPIKRVRIVLSPLTKEECMYHRKVNESIKASSPPVHVQQKESLHKTDGSLPDSVVTSSLSSIVQYSSSDEDYVPPSSLDENDIVSRIRRKKLVSARFPSYIEDRNQRLQRDPQLNQENTHTSESENSGTVPHLKRRRKSAPPVRYAPFAGIKRHCRDPDSYPTERSLTSDSESVISESVTTSSNSSEPPLVDLHI